MRHYIERILLDGSASLVTLAQKLQLTAAEMSEHLAVLEEEGFVYEATEGLWSLYSPHWSDENLDKIQARDIYTDDVQEAMNEPNGYNQQVRSVFVRGKPYDRYKYVGMVRGSRLIQVFIDYPQFGNEAPSVGVSAYNAEEEELRWYKNRKRGR